MELSVSREDNDMTDRIQVSSSSGRKKQHRETAKRAVEARKGQDYEEPEARRIDRRSRKLTLCLFCLVASISCLPPYISLHLTQRVGLLLFESDLLQFRSSLISFLICLLFLVIFHSLIFYSFNHKRNERKGQRKSLLIEKSLRQLIGLFAIISAISYLSITLIVPQIRQIQRMPIATFDCNANLITLENCHQQFTSSREDEQTIFEATSQLLAGDLNGNNERLIKKLNCLKYNDNKLKTLEVPTRFLLHNCGLVCRPQRQQLHQFSDDLNRNHQQSWSENTNKQPPPLSAESQQPLAAAADQRVAGMTHEISGTTNSPRQTINRLLIPPYSTHANLALGKEQLEVNEPAPLQRHFIYHNASSPSADHFSERSASIEDYDDESKRSQVSLRVCFSGEFSAGSNYKQFCITNLANNRVSGSGHHTRQDHTLTVGQLNAMLRRFMPSTDQYQATNLQQPDIQLVDQQHQSMTSSSPTTDRDDQVTHYMNPVVQFESHFKNWPHLPRSTLVHAGSGESIVTDGGALIEDSGSGNDEESSWCKFRPIPPFIVNNRPFSDIQCSLEHEYTITTGPSLDHHSVGSTGISGGSTGRVAADNIYLKKSSLEEGGNGGGGFARERCNIQCKVNILYQVYMGDDKSKDGDGDGSSKAAIQNDLHYYLPLKPCVIVSGDKSKASNYYLLFRSIGDSTLILVFILTDLFLLLESIDTKQSQYGGKKFRLVSVLLAIILLPLIVALLFDLISFWSPYYVSGSSRSGIKKDGYLTSFIYERLVPSFMDLFSSTSSSSKRRTTSSSSITADGRHQQHNMSSSYDGIETSGGRQPIIIDNYMVPFFIYSIFMFILAINSLAIPIVSSTAPLIRVSSTEELGMTANRSNSRDSNDGDGLTTSSSKIASATTRKQTNRLLKQQQTEITSAAKQKQQQTFSKQNKLLSPIVLSKSSKHRFVKMISFLLIALFMGTQFNLSQLTQTQILIESFGNPLLLSSGGGTRTSGGQSGGYTAFWFTLTTHSGAAIFVLLIALIFLDETSAYLGRFSPFNSTASASLNSDESKRNKAKFLKPLSISLLVYSARYFVLAHINSVPARFKWLVVFLFQVAELFNFPLTWLVLTTRAHEIITEQWALSQQQKSGRLQQSAMHAEARGHKQQQHQKHAAVVGALLPPASSTRALDVHMMVQSSLAFTYFVIARSLALFIHALHASLHLHSDNVDWFITSFYNNRQQPSTLPTTTTTTTTTSEQMTRPPNSHHVNSTSAEHHQPQLNGNHIKPTESLFSPLPAERQTYLHASRLFLKYNSLICLILGAILLVNLIYVKYQLWTEHKRTLNVFHSATTSRSPSQSQSSSRGAAEHDYTIDERLSLDLMQIHCSSPQNNLRTIYPSSTSGTTSPAEVAAAHSPRAKILFRYDLGRKDSSDESLFGGETPSGVQDNSTARLRSPGEDVETTEREESDLTPALQRPLQQTNRGVELRIPIGIEDEDEEVGEVDRGMRTGERPPSAQPPQPHPIVRMPNIEGVLERVTRHRSKKVRIFEDGESWPEIAASDRQYHQEVEGCPAPLVTYTTRSSNNYNKSSGGKLLNSTNSARTTTTSKLRDETMTKANKKRSITFAPTTTLIGDDGSSEQLTRHRQRQPANNNATNNNIMPRDNIMLAGGAQRASPEPSIDNDSDDDAGMMEDSID